MNKTKVRITEVRENKKFGGMIYAKLIKVDNDELCVAATLSYIFDNLRVNLDTYDCVNVTVDKWGNYCLMNP